jgi:hypothetical protein
VSCTVMTFVGPWPLTSRSNNCFVKIILYKVDLIHTHGILNITRKNCFRYLKLKVKVPRRSLRYVTHRLMVMYPHTKYHWPISKDKNVMAAKLVRTITFLSFQIGQLYMVCGCMTIRWCVAYHNDLRGTLTSRSNNCFLNSIFRCRTFIIGQICMGFLLLCFLESSLSYFY